MRLQGKETERRKEIKKEKERVEERDDERERDMDRERETRAAKEFNFNQAAKLKQRHLAAQGGDCGRSLLAVALAVKRLEINKHGKANKEGDGIKREGKEARWR